MKYFIWILSVIIWNYLFPNAERPTIIDVKYPRRVVKAKSLIVSRVSSFFFKKCNDFSWKRWIR